MWPSQNQTRCSVSTSPWHSEASEDDSFVELVSPVNEMKSPCWPSFPNRWKNVIAWSGSHPHFYKRKEGLRFLPPSFILVCQKIETKWGFFTPCFAFLSFRGSFVPLTWRLSSTGVLGTKMVWMKRRHLYWLWRCVSSGESCIFRFDTVFSLTWYRFSCMCACFLAGHSCGRYISPWKPQLDGKDENDEVEYEQEKEKHDVHGNVKEDVDEDVQ